MPVLPVNLHEYNNPRSGPISRQQQAKNKNSEYRKVMMVGLHMRHSGETWHSTAN